MLSNKLGYIQFWNPSELKSLAKANQAGLKTAQLLVPCSFPGLNQKSRPSPEVD